MSLPSISFADNWKKLEGDLLPFTEEAVLLSAKTVLFNLCVTKRLAERREHPNTKGVENLLSIRRLIITVTAYLPILRQQPESVRELKVLCVTELLLPTE